MIYDDFIKDFKWLIEREEWSIEKRMIQPVHFDYLIFFTIKFPNDTILEVCADARENVRDFFHEIKKKYNENKELCDHIIGTTEESWDGEYLIHKSELDNLCNIKGGCNPVWFNYCPLCGEKLND